MLTFEQTVVITLSGIFLSGSFTAITLAISQYFAHKNLKITHENDLRSFLFKDKIESLKSLAKASNALLSSFCTAQYLQSKPADQSELKDFIVKQRQLLNDFGTAYDLASLYLGAELSSQIDERLMTMQISSPDAKKAAEDFARLHAHILVFIKDEFQLSS